jgi:tetratricopeptide (TPR) repeat protein
MKSSKRLAPLVGGLCLALIWITPAAAQDTKDEAEQFRTDYAAFLDDLEQAASFLPSGFAVDPQASQAQQQLQLQLIDTQEAIHRAIAFAKTALAAKSTDELLAYRDLANEQSPNWPQLPDAVRAALNAKGTTTLAAFAQLPFGTCADGGSGCAFPVRLDVAALFWSDNAMAPLEEVANVICVIKEDGWCAPKWVIQGLRLGLQIAYDQTNFDYGNQAQAALADRVDVNVTSLTHKDDVGSQLTGPPSDSLGWCQSPNANSCFTKDECGVGEFCLNVNPFPHSASDPSPIAPTPAPAQPGQCVRTQPCSSTSDCGGAACIADNSPESDLHQKLNASLDARITTRASEDSVGVRTGDPGEFENQNLLQKLDDRLDITVTSRASQVSVDGRTYCISPERSVRTVTDSIEFIKLPQLEKAVDEALALAQQQASLVRDFTELYTRLQIETQLKSSFLDFTSAAFQLPLDAVGDKRAFCSRSVKVPCMNPGPNLVFGTPGGISDDDFPDDSLCPDQGRPDDTCNLDSGYCAPAGGGCLATRIPCTTNGDCGGGEICDRSVHHCNVNTDIFCTDDTMCPKGVAPEVCKLAPPERGFIELVDSIVVQSIDMVQAAGEKVHKAPQYLAKAHKYAAKGSYKRAYQWYRQAYREAAEMGPQSH